MYQAQRREGETFEQSWDREEAEWERGGYTTEMRERAKQDRWVETNRMILPSPTGYDGNVESWERYRVAELVRESRQAAWMSVDWYPAYGQSPIETYPEWVQGDRQDGHEDAASIECKQGAGYIALWSTGHSPLSPGRWDRVMMAYPERGPDPSEYDLAYFFTPEELACRTDRANSLQADLADVGRVWDRLHAELDDYHAHMEAREAYELDRMTLAQFNAWADRFGIDEELGSKVFAWLYRILRREPTRAELARAFHITSAV